MRRAARNSQCFDVQSGAELQFLQRARSSASELPARAKASAGSVESFDVSQIPQAPAGFLVPWEIRMRR
jgi:hypothetical protein